MHVVLWLASIDMPPDVTTSFILNSIDGTALLQLNGETLAGLGMASQPERASLLAQVKEVASGLRCHSALADHN